MRMIVEFKPGDTAVHRVLDELLPTQENREDFIGAVEARFRYRLDGKESSSSSADDIRDVLRDIDTTIDQLANHGLRCQAISLRNSSLCDCPEGKLHRLAKSLYS